VSNEVNGLQSAPDRPILHLRSLGEVPMNVLASLFKRDGLVEKHQLEGVDPSDRYFNRAVLVNRTSSGYSARMMYEALTVEGQSHPTVAAAIVELVEKLQSLGFSRLRTRANFKGTKYLAEKETWIEYQDPA
jgi:hypothetical protein